MGTDKLAQPDGFEEASFPDVKCSGEPPDGLPSAEISLRICSGDENLREAVANLPAMFRFAMVLSYLDGFSNGEIAKMIGVEPQAIESLLRRGHGILREAFFEYLKSDDNLDTATDRAAAKG